MSINIGNLAGGIELNDQLTQALEKIHDRLTLTGVDFEQLDKKVLASNTVLGQAANVQITLQGELAKTNLLVSGHAKALDDLAKVALTGAAAAKQLAPEIDKEAKALLIAKAQADAMRQSMGLLNKEFNTVQETAKISTQQIVAFGRGLQEAGVLMTGAVTVPLVAAATAALHFGSEFETAMTKVIATGGVAREEVEALRPAVLQISEQMGKSASDVAVALDIIGSAAYRGAEAQEILAKSTQMSAIGMGTTEETARAVVGALKTFKNENLSAAEASDILVRTVQLGNMHISDLVGSLARINPVAAAMGVKFADVNATIATFTHLGASADVAATGIRAILSTLLNDGAKTEKGLRGLGIEMKDVIKTIQEKGLAEALIMLVETANKTEDGLQKLSQVFPNIRALTTVLATAGAQGEDFLKINQKIRESAGALDEAFAEVSKTWKFQWDQLVVSLQNVAIELSDALLPLMKDFVAFTKEYVLPVIHLMVEGFKALPEPLQLLGIAIGGFLVSIGPALIGIGTLVRSIGHIMAFGPELVKVVPQLKTFFGIFTGATEIAITGAGIATAAATIGVIIGALYDLYKVLQIGTILWGWWGESRERAMGAKSQAVVDAANAARNIEIMAKAAEIAKHPVTDMAEATQIMQAYFQGVGASADAAARGVTTVGAASAEAAEEQNAAALMAELHKNSLAGLSDVVKETATELFNEGASVSQAFKAMKTSKLVTDEQRLAFENLFDVLKSDEKMWLDIAKAQEEAAYAYVPLTKAQEEEAKWLLELKVGHEVIAKTIGAHVSQVNALVASKEKADKALKMELKAIDELEKAWTKYYTEAELLGATDSQKIVIKADADYQKIVEKLQDAGVSQVEYYEQAWKLRDMDIAKENQELLLKDKNSKAYLLNQLADAKATLAFRLENRNQYKEADIQASREEIKNLESMRDHWGQIGHAIDKNIEKVKTLSGEILTMKEYEARQLAGGSFDVTSQNFQKTVTGLGLDLTRALQLAKKGYSLQEISSILGSKGGGPIPPPAGPRIPGFKEGGWGDFKQGTLAMLHGKEAIVPMSKMGPSKVTIEKGAFSFNYPIMTDRRSMTEFAQVIDSVIVNRLHDLGVRD